MPAESIAITECRTHLSRLTAEVARTGRPIVVTRNGTPLVEIRPLESPARASLKGSLRQLVSDEELIAPFADAWNATR